MKIILFHNNDVLHISEFQKKVIYNLNTILNSRNDKILILKDFPLHFQIEEDFPRTKINSFVLNNFFPVINQTKNNQKSLTLCCNALITTTENEFKYSLPLLQIQNIYNEFFISDSLQKKIEYFTNDFSKESYFPYKISKFIIAQKKMLSNNSFEIINKKWLKIN